jgi:zinc transporter ZupT
LNPEIWRTKNFLAVLSGWINPLIVLYLVLLLIPILRWPRRIVAGIITAFIAGTWVFFVLYPLVPLIGHVLWIAGILMILAGEVMGRKKPESYS